MAAHLVLQAFQLMSWLLELSTARPLGNLRAPTQQSAHKCVRGMLELYR